MNAFSLCVLGGSSPFTAGLIDALRDSEADLAACRVTLQGRTSAALSLLGSYAQHQLAGQGVQIASTTQLERALEGADVILHQIRYGGLELRHQGEELCARWSVAADETLGPAALLTAVASLEGLRRTTAAIVRTAPAAWVLNLTNPLSSVTSIMRSWGVARCIGLCELPELTHRAAAALLRVAPERLAWAYSGFNHRGFLHDLSVDSNDVLPNLLSAIQTRGLPGIHVSDVEYLRAIPLKYFALLSHPTGGTPGRARHLGELRARVECQLAMSRDTSPTALADRNQDWYPLAVLPVLWALFQSKPSSHVVNVFHDGLVRETPTLINSQEVRPITQPTPNAPVRRWLDIFENHERRFLEALTDPGPTSIEAVLAQDPLVPKSLAQALAAEVWDAVRTYDACRCSESSVAAGCILSHNDRPLA